jgi:Zn-dependent protease
MRKLLNPHGTYHFLGISTSKKELLDILKAWVAISAAFGIAMNGGKLLSSGTFVSFILAFLTVGTGFLFHELGHKVLAQKYGCWAEFRADPMMLMLALLMSFFGFIFAAPGAVMIGGPVGTERNGKISAIGPLMNLVMATLFFALALTFGTNLLFMYGIQINSWLALFNLIPFSIIDGAKIFRWSKPVWIVLLGLAIGFMYLPRLL